MSASTRFPNNSIVALPKAEIHIHIEGCFDLTDLERLASQVNEPLLRPRDRLFQFDGLSDFLQFLDWTCGLVRTQSQLAEAGYSLCQRLSKSGVRYCDAIVNPTHWRLWRDRIPELIEGLHQGFVAAEQDALPPVGLCISLLRTQSGTEALDLVDLLLKLNHPRVVALSIDGNEAKAGRTGPRFAQAFRKAAEGGLRRTVHAGESSGPEGVRDALEFLHADRIDHGVRAIEDPELVKILAEKGIPLGICPASNLTLGLYPKLDQHPLEQLRRAGVPVSINTDDPAPLGLALHSEYESCASAFNWSVSDLQSIAKTSIEASFADADTKKRLLQELAGWDEGFEPGDR